MSKLVKFGDGKFGLRKGCWLFGYRFQDFLNPYFSWTMKNLHFSDCKTTEEHARSFLNNSTYKVVKN